MNGAARTTLSFAVFFVAVVGMTFVSTFVHELSHAAAWGDVPAITFAEDRDAATAAVTHDERMYLQPGEPGHPGHNYQVSVVDHTTIAMYPKSILAAGLTLGLAPASLLPDPVMASTFYALDDDDYVHLARGEDVTQWYHAAMPMMVNAVLGIPIMVWLWFRPSPISMAAAWVNASEWRFNMHHAAEIGLAPGLYLGFALAVMAAVAIMIGYLAARGVRFSAPGTTPATL